MAAERVRHTLTVFTLHLRSKWPAFAVQVKAACNKPGLVPKLEIIVVELEKCKKSLSEYLRYVVRYSKTCAPSYV